MILTACRFWSGSARAMTCSGSSTIKPVAVSDSGGIGATHAESANRMAPAAKVLPPATGGIAWSSTCWVMVLFLSVCKHLVPVPRQALRTGNCPKAPDTGSGSHRTRHRLAEVLKISQWGPPTIADHRPVAAQAAPVRSSKMEETIFFGNLLQFHNWGMLRIPCRAAGSSTLSISR